MRKTNIRTYSELSKIKDFKDRYEYLKLDGSVCDETFGFDRYLNQKFYKSDEWKKIREYVIVRDNGCDLGCPDHKIIDDKILIHHLNPIRKEDIINKNESILNPEYLITTTKKTHDAIHYGSNIAVNEYTERFENDTCPWKVRRN